VTDGHERQADGPTGQPGVARHVATCSRCRSTTRVTDAVRRAAGDSGLSFCCHQPVTWPEAEVRAALAEVARLTHALVAAQVERDALLVARVFDVLRGLAA
jgi:hypothetical protein